MKTLLAMFVPLVQYGPLIFIAGCFLAFFIFLFIVIVYSYETAPPDQKKRMEERWENKGHHKQDQICECDDDDNYSFDSRNIDESMDNKWDCLDFNGDDWNKRWKKFLSTGNHHYISR